MKMRRKALTVETSGADAKPFASKVTLSSLLEKRLLQSLHAAVDLEGGAAPRAHKKAPASVRLLWAKKAFAVGVVVASKNRKPSYNSDDCK